MPRSADLARRQQLRALVDERRRHAARAEIRVIEHGLQERDVRGDPADAELRDRARARPTAVGKSRPAAGQLDQHRVEVRADLRAQVPCRRPAGSRPARRAVGDDPAGVGTEPVRRVLGGDPALQRRAVQRDRRPGCRPRSANVSPDAIRSCDGTRSTSVISSVTVCSTWMRGFISMNTCWPRSSSRNSTVPAQVYRLPRERDRVRADLVAQLRVQVRRRRDFDDLLVAALHAAVPLVEVDHVAGVVGQDLHLDVARIDHRLLEEHRRVAERRFGLTAGGLDRLGQCGASSTRRIPRPPPPATALTNSGKPMPPRAASSSSTDADGSDDASTGSPAPRAAAIARALLPVSSNTSRRGRRR